MGQNQYYDTVSKSGIRYFQKMMADLGPGCSLSCTGCGAGMAIFYEAIEDWSLKFTELAK